MDEYHKLRAKLAQWSDPALTVAIIIWALIIIVLAITIKNRWIKAGLLAWEVLP